MRFNASEAVAAGDGLYTGCTGLPDTPHWLGAALLSWSFRSNVTNDLARLVRSSSGIAVLASPRSDSPAQWIELGRVYERFALGTTAVGARTSMLNQAIGVADVRRHLAAQLGLQGREPALIVRFGYGPLMPRSLRRPLDSVIRSDATSLA